jgi:hypothetical protein
MELTAAAPPPPLSPLEAVQALLEERLPVLGLDVETYGPYVVSLLPTTVDSLVPDLEDCTTDSVTTLDSNNAEEWDSVWELLQASSESHSDDAAVWKSLQQEIADTFANTWRLEQQFRRARYQESEVQRLAHEQEERNLALQAAELEQERKLAAAANQTNDDDEVKKALVSRFAYEEEDDEDETGTATASSSSALPPMLSNRDVAKQVEAAKAQELRAHKTQTKKEEQAKTKETKLHKEKLKEARQQRAVKGACLCRRILRQRGRVCRPDVWFGTISTTKAKLWDRPVARMGRLVGQQSTVSMPLVVVVVVAASVPKGAGRYRRVRVCDALGVSIGARTGSPMSMAQSERMARHGGPLSEPATRRRKWPCVCVVCHVRAAAFGFFSGGCGGWLDSLFVRVGGGAAAASGKGVVGLDLSKRIDHQNLKFGWLQIMSHGAVGTVVSAW